MDYKPEITEEFAEYLKELLIKLTEDQEQVKITKQPKEGTA